MIKKSGPPSTNADCETIKVKVADNKFVMAFFGKEDDALYTDAFLKVAEAEDRITFLHNTDAACATEMNIPTPGVMFFRKFEEERVTYSGSNSQEDLSNFFKPLMVPTLFKFTEEEIDAIFGQQQNTAILFRKEGQASEAFSTQFELASKEHKGKLLFSYSDGSVDIQEKLADFMGVSESDFPTLRVITPAKMLKFKFEDTEHLTSSAVGAWIDSILDGSARPHLKSEPVPEDNNGPVKTIVGTQFDEIVLDSERDVLVKYYAPWCGHCKKLAPIWEELGEVYRDNDKIVIAKFDATANEAAGVDVRGYPTIIFYPSGGAAQVNYEGERDLENF